MPSRAAAFFDLDKTIIAKSSTLAFSRSFYQGGLISRASVLRSSYAQFIFLVAGTGQRKMDRMRRYLTAQATGWDVETVKAAEERLVFALPHELRPRRTERSTADPA